VTTSAEALDRGRLGARERAMIGVLLVSTFVVLLNETIMSVALPVLMTDLRVGASVGQWLTAGFLTMSVVIPIAGFLIRRVPTRTLYAAAILLFSTGALLAAVAPGFGVLLAGRVARRRPGPGVVVARAAASAGGTAIMMSLLMTTVMTLVPLGRRGVLMGNLSIVISVAPALGPTVSGVVLDLLGCAPPCSGWPPTRASPPAPTSRPS
jgi:DHA2 family lincomycin resistance protein-like MFS transporter